MRKKLLYISFFILLISCKQKGIETEYSTKSSSNDKIEADIFTEQNIESDLLITEMENDLNEMVKNPKFLIEKEFIKNKYVDNLIDTITIFKFDKTIIKSYKTSNKEWIIEAQIQNPEFELRKSIEVGMEKKALENILKTKLNSDLVKISDLEGTSEFTFKLEKDILREIVYEGYLD